MNKTSLECALDADITNQKRNKQIQNLKNIIINLQQDNIKTSRKLDRRNQQMTELENQIKQLLKKKNEVLAQNSLTVCLSMYIFVFAHIRLHTNNIKSD